MGIRWSVIGNAVRHMLTSSHGCRRSAPLEPCPCSMLPATTMTDPRPTLQWGLFNLMTLRSNPGAVAGVVDDTLQMVKLAEQVDQLSGGRLVLGVGSGYQPHEFERYGVDLAQKAGCGEAGRRDQAPQTTTLQLFLSIRRSADQLGLAVHGAIRRAGAANGKGGIARSGLRFRSQVGASVVAG
jgi:hypothetical protein